MLLSRQSQYPIGLDISDLMLRLVQLKKIGKKITVQAIAHTGLSPGLIENGEIKDLEKIAGIINKLISNPKLGKFTSSDVVACLPETHTFIKLIEVEKTSNNLSETIETEIKKYIPYSLDEIFYDWQLIEESPNKRLVIIGATPQKIVNQYTLLIEKSKLSIEALEIEAVAICRSLLAEESPHFTSPTRNNYGLIDIGAKRTSMIFYSGNTLLFTISMPISGQKITKKIAKTLEIEFNQAEKAKIICGLDENKAQGIIRKILTEMINNLITRIKEAINYYQKHLPEYGQLNQIILCGGGANINNLDQILAQALSVDVKIGNSLTNMGVAKEQLIKNFIETHKLSHHLLSNKKRDQTLSLKQDNSSAFTTAIGLALRGIFSDEI